MTYDDYTAGGGEGQYSCTPTQAANVARGSLEMALWGLEVGITPTKQVEDQIADVIRRRPEWHRQFQDGTPDDAGTVVRLACEAWLILTAHQR